MKLKSNAPRIFLFLTAVMATGCLLDSPRLQDSISSNLDEPRSTASQPGQRLQVKGSVDSVTWTPDGATLVFHAKQTVRAGRSYAIHAWDLARGSDAKLMVTDLPVTAVAVAPDGNHFACTVWPDGDPTPSSEVWLYEMESKKRIKKLQMAPPTDLAVPFHSDLLSLDFSPDRQLVAAGGKLVSLWPIDGQHIGGEVCVWNLNSGELLWHDRTTHSDMVYSVIFSPTGLLASAGADKLIRFWDAENSQLTRTLTGATWDGVVSVSFSVDGSMIATGGRGTEEGDCVRVWNLESGRVIHTLRGFQKQATVRADFSPNGNSLFGVGLREESSEANPVWELRQWDMQSGRLVRIFAPENGYCRSLAVSPTGAKAAVGTGAGEVVIYDI